MLLRPTCTTLQSLNILDLFLTSVPLKVTSLTYLRGLSDHNVICTTLTAPVNVKLVSNEVIRPYDKVDYLQINEELCSFFADAIQPKFSTHSVEDNWSLFRSTLANHVHKYIPPIHLLNLILPHHDLTMH